MPLLTVIRNRLRQVDWWGYLTVLLICLLAIWPFLSRAALPQETDAELHIFRLAELSRMVRGGELYPRWAANFYFGYGYPIFNYYAPLSYYVGLFFELMPRIGAVTAVKIVFVLGLLLAGLGMYGYVRDNWGRRAGFVAAAVYVYAPYIQYIDPYARGVLAESFSFGVFALTLWAFDRLRRKRSAGNWLAAVCGMAAVVLTHNLMAMVFAGILLGWVLWFSLPGEANPIRDTSSLLLATCLGIGLAAFFWLPVALERDAVNLNTLVGEAGSHFDFRQHFLPLRELFAPSQWLDWGATEPTYHFNLGVAQWLLGGVGAGFALWRLGQRRLGSSQPLFFVLMAVVLIWLMLPAADLVWEAVPLLPFIQFPWRLLGGAAAMLAPLAGYGVYELTDLMAHQRRWSAAAAWLPTAAIALTLLLAAPLTQVAPWPRDFGETTAGRVAYLETRGRWLGTTSTADFVPATVDIIPKPEHQLLDALLAEQTPDRINYWSVEQAGAKVTWKQLRPLHALYTISTPVDFIFRLFLFKFPGWETRVDGVVVEADRARPEGFLVVPVPAGEHVVDVEFVDTPARKMGWMVSAAALLVTLVIGYQYAVSRRYEVALLARRSGRDDRVLVGVAAVVVALLLAGRLGWLRYNSVETAEPAQVPLRFTFDGQVALIGADINRTELMPGETLELTVYWRALRPLEINYQSFVHVLAADGFLVAQADKLNPSDYPTRRWPQDKYVRDHYTIILPESISPGPYRVSAGLWVQSEGWRLPVADAAGEEVGDVAPLFEIEVGAP